MSVTRKSLIINKYTDFQEILKKNDFEEELMLLPSLGEIDVSDLCYYLTLTFMGVNEEEQFKEKIIVLSELNDIKLTEKKLDLLTSLLSQFMIWLRAL